MFSNMELGKESTSTVVIRNNTERPIRIKDIVTDPKTLVTNVKKHTRILAKKEFTLEARYTPGNTSTLSGRVTVMTDNTEMETIEISVLGSISPTRNK